MVFEAFEVSPQPDAVLAAAGKLICSYPGPAAHVSLDIATNPGFIDNLALFLTELDVDPLDSNPTTTKAGSTVTEERGTADPRYISELLMGILLGVGVEAQVPRISKRIGDDVLWNSAFKPWRRSPLWLVIRVATQTSIASRDAFKSFMIFFQAQLLRRFLDCDFPSDVLSMAVKKTSRRVYKLGATIPPFVMDDITAVSSAIRERLQDIWTREQEAQATSWSPWTPDPRAITDDTAISLPHSRAYLTEVLQSTPISDTSTSFEPSETTRIQGYTDFYEFRSNKIARTNQDDGNIALADFESMVHEHLDGWVSQHLRDTDVCSVLASCLDQYTASATDLYRDSPEDQSIMLLTIMELWVALDKAAVAQIPLLCNYSPEIPQTVLEPLLLRRALHIERAAAVELYLRGRHAAAGSFPSAFSNSTSCSSFAIRYYEQAPHLQNLRQQIENHATEARRQKLAELNEKNQSHASLQHQARSLAHEYYNVLYRSYHSSGCERCRLKRQAKEMRIEVHEWPLPRDHDKAKAVVFELQCPPIFSTWRDQTWRIFRDVALRHSESKPVRQFGLVDNGLTSWSDSEGPLGRVTMASPTKSFLQAHYRAIQLPSHDSAVCVDNGLTFQLYDQTRQEWTTDFLFLSPTFAPYCVLQLPAASPYISLQHFVKGVTHTSNEVIASQADCPDELNIHEYISYGSLRSGGSLQWLNIARELRADILSLSREEVHTLITQAAWELGPLDNSGARRSWHEELEEANFGIALAEESLSLSSRVEFNWLEGVSERTIGMASSSSCELSPSYILPSSLDHEPPTCFLTRLSGTSSRISRP